MALNEVKILGTINSEFLMDSGILPTENECIKFTVVCGDAPVVCIATGYLSQLIQRKCTTGALVYIVGKIIAYYRGKTLYNYVVCNKVFLNGEEGFVSHIEDRSYD